MLKFMKLYAKKLSFSVWSLKKIKVNDSPLKGPWEAVNTCYRVSSGRELPLAAEDWNRLMVKGTHVELAIPDLGPGPTQPLL